MSVISRIGIISAIYKKGDIIKRYCKLQTHITHAILKNLLQQTLDTTIGENWSAAITKIEQFCILFLLFVTKSMSQIN